MLHDLVNKRLIVQSNFEKKFSDSCFHLET